MMSSKSLRNLVPSVLDPRTYSSRWKKAMNADATYCCGRCGMYLNASSNDLYPPGFYFDAGNRGTLSFFEIDMTKFQKQKEKRCRSCFPFCDSRNSWGLHRKRTQLRCAQCSLLLGYIYYDVPESVGHAGWGPSHAAARGERYRLKIKALQEAPVDPQTWQ